MTQRGYPYNLSIRFAATLLPLNLVEDAYVNLGMDVGLDLSDMFATGGALGWELRLDWLVFWEGVYAAKGYNPIPMKAFEYAGGYGKSEALEDLIHKKKNPGQEPTLYASLFRDEGWTPAEKPYQDLLKA